MTTLRRATVDDVEFLRVLHVDTMRAYVEQTWGWDDADQRARFDAALNLDAMQIIVHDDHDVGALVVRRASDAIVLAEIEIMSTWQGRGIGTQLVAAIIADAARTNLPVRLQVLKVNTAARRLYERLGFRVDGETPTHHLMINASSEES